MTTVDVYITGGGNSLSLHNGMFGPATTVYHAAYDASRNGTAVGGWNSYGKLDVTITGRELRKVLSQIEQLTPHHQGPEYDESLHRFRESIMDDGTYQIRGMEY